MAECLNYNCDELEDHESLDTQCLGPRPSGIGEAVFILCGNTVTEENASDGTFVNALISSQDARLVQLINLGLDSAEPVLSPFPASPCRPAQTLYVNFTGSIVDIGFTATNMTFWNQLINGYSIAGMIARLCPKDGWDDESLYMDGEITFTGSPLVPKEGTDVARFELTYTFRGSVKLIPTPAGVFE